MDCYPPCRTCTGLCKVQVPERRVAASKPVKKKPVTPVEMPGYLVFLCGHYDTVENQRIIFSLLERPFPRSWTRSTRFWCEKDNRWVRLMAMPERIEMDRSEPLPF